MSTYEGPAELVFNGETVPVHAVLSSRRNVASGLGSWDGRLRTTDAGDLFPMLGANVDLVIGDHRGEVIITHLPLIDGDGWATVTGSGPPPF